MGIVSACEIIFFYILSFAKASFGTILGSFCSSLPCYMPVKATATLFEVQFEQLID